MTEFPAGIGFKYPWRAYQERVLGELQDHLEDGRLHVVAAPGSGKTALGLEVMLRLGRPTLILAPTLTIRDQWADRFIKLFLPEGAGFPTWLSTDIHAPGFVTIGTYQALHSDTQDEKEAEEESAAWEAEENESESSPSRDATTSALVAQGVGTLILDEAHHLHRAWWQALESVREALPKATVVALTATPPYDLPAAEWERYEALCGPIDTEVPAPELVLTGDLCCHQDYVYFATLTAEELAQAQAYREDVQAFVHALLADEEFTQAIRGHRWVLQPLTYAEEVLESPEFFSSMLIFMQHARVPFAKEARHLLGAEHTELPELTLAWLEVLLQGCTGKFRETFTRQEAVLDRVTHELQHIGAMERGRVSLRASAKLDHNLITSQSKLHSIAAITKLESEVLGEALRLVILTDYIRAADLPMNRDDVSAPRRLGVAPIFETLRRAMDTKIRLAALSGSLVIIPTTTHEALSIAAQEVGILPEQLRLVPLAHDANYLRVEVRGVDHTVLVHLLTRLFTRGEITTLVGTKSLLGEGWDAPCTNVLILASFVGSFMLSNQMRGRAIRTRAEQPEKTANIWHLVCVDPEASEPGEDMETLTRRFRAFIGVSCETPVIESGIERLGLGAPPYSAARVKVINESMSRQARDRTGLRERWQEALRNTADFGRMQEQLRLPMMASHPWPMQIETIRSLLLEGLYLGGFVASEAARVFLTTIDSSSSYYLWGLALVFLLGAVVAAPRAIKALWLLLRYGPVEASLKQMGTALLEAMQQAKLISVSDSQLQVVIQPEPLGLVSCTLAGGSSYDTSVFLTALEELLDPVDNPRYLIVRRSLFAWWSRVDYHAVPSALGRQKELAEFFARAWRRRVGPTELIFTRSVEGRKVLLRARLRSLAAAMHPEAQRRSCWR